jgi:hypothetical protein
MSFVCFTYPGSADLDGWGTVAVFLVIVYGKNYWKLSDKVDNTEKNAKGFGNLGPNEAKIEILAKNFKFSNSFKLILKCEKSFHFKISSKKIVPVRFACHVTVAPAPPRDFFK